LKSPKVVKEGIIRFGESCKEEDLIVFILRPGEELMELPVLRVGWKEDLSPLPGISEEDVRLIGAFGFFFFFNDLASMNDEGFEGFYAR